MDTDHYDLIGDPEIKKALLNDREKGVHNWVFDFFSPHNREYWYKCSICGATDWISSTGDPNNLPGKCTAITPLKEKKKAKRKTGKKKIKTKCYVELEGQHGRFR